MNGFSSLRNGLLAFFLAACAFLVLKFYLRETLKEATKPDPSVFKYNTGPQIPTYKSDWSSAWQNTQRQPSGGSLQPFPQQPTTYAPPTYTPPVYTPPAPPRTR